MVLTNDWGWKNFSVTLEGLSLKRGSGNEWGEAMYFYAIYKFVR